MGDKKHLFAVLAIGSIATILISSNWIADFGNSHEINEMSNNGSHRSYRCELNLPVFDFAESGQVDAFSDDSSQVSLRGNGDSLLPFQLLYAEQMDNRSKDIFIEEPLGTEYSTPDKDNPPLKKILYWNDAYGGKHFGIGFGREPFLRAKCPVNTCFATHDRNRFKMEEVDAVIWHVRSSDRSLPRIRSPHTRYVFWMMESAYYIGTNVNPIRYTFNWTFTYRRDSDFPYKYNNVYRRRTPISLPDYKDVTTGKKKLAAWFVSNCHGSSNREMLVKDMQKYMEVDIYGHCGKLTCIRKNQKMCHKMLEKDYKFYLSFENSLCVDYITEKFFLMLKLNIVPVVYGLGDYSAIAPPHSYINALDFSSAKDLTDYLKYLDKNDTAYIEYFRWKAYHKVSDDRPRRMIPACDLCARLHTDEKKVTDLDQWFIKDSHCKLSFLSARDFHLKQKTL